MSINGDLINNTNIRVEDNNNKNDINDFKSTHVDVNYYIKSDNNSPEKEREKKEDLELDKKRFEKIPWDVKLLFALPSFGKMACLLLLR